MYSFAMATYVIDDPIVFTTQDSGTLDKPITYKAYPGEAPVISGGVKLTGHVAGF